MALNDLSCLNREITLKYCIQLSKNGLIITSDVCSVHYTQVFIH